MSAPEPPRRPPPEQPPTEPLNRPAARLEPRGPVEPAPYAYERVPPAEALPPERRWDGSGLAVLAGIVALLVGGLVGYLIGQGSENEGHGVARTVTSTATVTHPQTVVQTQTVTASTVRETPSAANQANEQHLSESEANLRKAEQDNKELRRKLEEAGGSP